MISDDGKRAASPMVGGILVVNGLKLKEEVLKLPRESPGYAIGFDPKSGNIYYPTTDTMQVFSKQGEKLAAVKLIDNEVRRILVDPRGDRFLAFGKRSFTIYDLQGNRLKQ